MNPVQAMANKLHSFSVKKGGDQESLPPEELPSDFQGFSRRELREKEPLLFNFLYKETFEPKKREEIERSSLLERIGFFNKLYEIGLEKIKIAEGKDLSLIIGRGRCGKSLYFCWVMGDKIIRDPFDADSFIVQGVSSSNVGPNRGQRSATILPVIKSLGSEGLLLADTPGKEDSRANEVLLVNTLLQQRLLSLAKTTSITILVSYNILNEDYIRWADFLRETRERYGITEKDQELGNAPVRIVVLRQRDLEKARMKLRNEGSGDYGEPLCGKIGFPIDIYNPLEQSKREAHINQIKDLTKWKIQPTIVLTDGEKTFCSDLFHNIKKELLIKTNSPSSEKETLRQASDETRVYMEVLEKLRSAAGEGVESSYFDAKLAHKNYLKELGIREFKDKTFEKTSEAFTNNKETLENCECIENNQLAYENGFSLLYRPAKRVESAIASIGIGILGCALAIPTGGLSLGVASLFSVAAFCDYNQLDQALVNKGKDFYKYSLNNPKEGTPVQNVLKGIKISAQGPVYRDFNEKKTAVLGRLKGIEDCMNKSLLRLETLKEGPSQKDERIHHLHHLIKSEFANGRDLLEIVRALYLRIEGGNYSIENREDILYKYLVEKGDLSGSEEVPYSLDTGNVNFAKSRIEGQIFTFIETLVHSLDAIQKEIREEDFVQKKEVKELDDFLAKGVSEFRSKQKELTSSMNDLNISYKQLEGFRKLEEDCRKNRYYEDTTVTRILDRFKFRNLIS